MAKRKPDKEYYVKYVERCRKEAEDASRPLRAAWKELWQAYQSRQDNTKKASWQSKAFAPKVFMQIERSAGEIKRAMMHTRKLFKLELVDLAEQRQIQALNAELMNTLDANMMGQLKEAIDKVERAIQVRADAMSVRDKEFKQSLQETNLVNIYSVMVKSAFLLGLGIPKVLWDARAGRPKYEHVDSFNIFVSPDYMPFQEDRPPYVVEYKRMKLANLLRLARSTNKTAGHKIYDMSEVKQIEEDAVKQDIKVKERQRRGEGMRETVGKEVEILEFWGDVISEDGKEVEENQLLQIANGKYLIRKQENPFHHGLPPYVLTMPIPYPHRGACGVSLAAPQVKLNYTYNNILNMYVDNLNYSVNKVFEYNPTDLVDPKGLTAVYPGKRIAVNTESQKQAIREVMTAPMGKDAILALQLLDKVMDEGSNVNEFISGSPSKKAKTLGEIELKSALSRGLFDVIARDLEQNSLKQVLEMSYDLHEQFGDYEARPGNYNIIVGGISLLLLQKELVERVGEVLGIALSRPDIAGMTDIADLWKKLLSIYNLSDVYVEPDTMAERVSPEQLDSVRAQASEDAKRDVAEMPPERIMKLVGAE